MMRNSIKATSLCSSLVLLGVCVLPANAQVFDSGPSDPALFDRVINLPPDPNIGDSEEIGDDADGSTTQLNVADGGEVGDFLTACGTEVNISGGTVGNDFSATGGEVNISGGTVGERFRPNGGVVNITGGSVGATLLPNGGAVINISGGSVGGGFVAQASLVNISGGVVGSDFTARGSNKVNISGGTIGDNFSAVASNEVNISGGIVGEGIQVGRTNEVNLFGSEFILDGMPLGGLVLGQASTIADRDVTLSGLLADGSAFSFGLDSTDPDSGEDFFAAGATLTVTLTSGSGVVGDFSGNAVVNCDDLDGYVGNLEASVNPALELLDLDGDGVLTAADAETHIRTLVQTSNGQAGTFPGDLNCDGQVSVLGDAFPLVSNLGLDVTSYSDGDLNFDGTVSVLGDAFVLVANLGMTNEP